METVFNSAKIKKVTFEFMEQMGFSPSAIEVQEIQEGESGEDKQAVGIELDLDDPKILIGQGGQTLAALQRLLRIVLNKQLGQFFYVNLDINEYKAKKAGYLKQLAQELAQEVSLTGHPKVLSPMPSYERRILHQELERLGTVISESQGGETDRHIVVKPK